VLLGVSMKQTEDGAQDCSAVCRGLLPPEWGRKKPRIRAKKPPFGDIFFALLPPLCYGLPLESWGPHPVKDGHSKTQEKRGFLRHFNPPEKAFSDLGTAASFSYGSWAMKINVERGAFLKALSHVQSVVERRNTIP